MNNVDPTAKAAISQARVIVADDFPDTAETLGVLLSAEGFEVRLARDGEVARQLILQWRPHACVLDLTMPSLDGDQSKSSMGLKPASRTPRAMPITPLAELAVSLVVERRTTTRRISSMRPL